ncbi:N-formylglutamate amidohydrolase [Rhizobacter sp. Root1221]|uniref:N-formylglutamate amidohydrolase n=1 Tax=Rhizobacter sp. Root1221 TaxID=1736433 RepID=UPI0006FE88C5|nr:N-formylglutamate amidohydrolase [Rhizobacter sp. Root1221]KQV92789.1 N-formylglutamate amidohydrolase [Rhizobacter sp. Root1221]
MNLTDWISVVDGRPGLALPLVCDSPHSGVDYPADFGHALPLADLRTGEDTHVERLWGHAPEVGATLVCARFPRTYIDPNRPLDDLDPTMLASPWPRPLHPSRKSELGFGLVWRHVRRGAAIYNRKLSVDEVQRRIRFAWSPYHAALSDALSRAMATYGACWHLNLHSMPHDAYERLGVSSATPLADFVLGDRHGTSCDPEFVEVVAQALAAHGFRVSLNDPYSGQELVRLAGDPARKRHSLQVEINRSLYMDETTREPNAHFEDVRESLASVLEEIARYVRLRVT